MIQVNPIQVKTAAGKLAALLHPEADGLKECWIDNTLNGACTLEFELPLTSDKWAEITHDCLIYAGGREFALLKEDAIDEVRDGLKLWGKVMAIESWKLLDKKFVSVANDGTTPSWAQAKILSGGTPAGGYSAGSAGSALTYLLQGSGWSLGTCDVSGTHDLETEKESLLSNIQKVQELWGGYLVWDSVNHVLHLRSEALWQNYTGYQIRYAKNIKGITRTVDNNIITRLYPFGKDDLDIGSVNTDIHEYGYIGDKPEGQPSNVIYLDSVRTSTVDDYYNGKWITVYPDGKEYPDNYVGIRIEDYEGATHRAVVSGNVSPAQPGMYYEFNDIYISCIYLDNFTYTTRILEGTYVNQDIADATELKIKATEYLAKMCQPRYNYSIKMVDTTCLPEWSHESYAMGDMVDVIDEPMNITARCRLIRHKYNVFQPWKCDMELGDPLAKLETMIAGTVRASEFVKEALKPNLGVKNILKGFVDTFATEINGAKGGYECIDGQATWYELDESGEKTGKLVRLTPSGMYISDDGGVNLKLAMTGDGILANTIICSAVYALSSEDGYTKMVDSGLQVFDSLNHMRVHIGQYVEGKFGIKIWDKTGNVTLLDEDGIMQTWQDSRADNVDANHGLLLNLYLPAETKSINKALLRFKLQAFRAYETGAASGGGSTSGASSTSTTDSKESVTQTSQTSALWEQFAITVPDAVSYANGHIHTLPDGAQWKDVNGNTLTWGYGGAHGHSLTSDHQHEIEIPSHNHGMSHTHTTPNHTHAISYGIYESTTPSLVTVKVGNTTVGSYYSDQTSIDLSSYLTIGGWNTVTITPNQLGRIDASIFIQAKMGV